MSKIIEQKKDYLISENFLNFRSEFLEVLRKYDVYKKDFDCIKEVFFEHYFLKENKVKYTFRQEIENNLKENVCLNSLSESLKCGNNKCIDSIFCMFCINTKNYNRIIDEKYRETLENEYFKLQYKKTFYENDVKTRLVLICSRLQKSYSYFCNEENLSNFAKIFITLTKHGYKLNLKCCYKEVNKIIFTKNVSSELKYIFKIHLNSVRTKYSNKNDMISLKVYKSKLIKNYRKFEDYHVFTPVSINDFNNISDKIPNDEIILKSKNNKCEECYYQLNKCICYLDDIYDN